MCCPGLRRDVERHALAIARRVFLDDDGVGAVRHHAAGEDAHRLARAERFRRRDVRPATMPIDRERRAGAFATSAARTA